MVALVRGQKVTAQHLGVIFPRSTSKVDYIENSKQNENRKTFEGLKYRHIESTNDLCKIRTKLSCIVTSYPLNDIPKCFWNKRS